jgi:hypothetical protein
LSKLATGKLELEVKGEPPPAASGKESREKQDQEKEGFTAWGKEAGGLQAGLGYLPDQHRAYHTGETVTLVVRVRNVSKEPVKFQYIPNFFVENPPTVMDVEGNQVHFGYGVLELSDGHSVVDVNLAPGKEIKLGEVKLPTTLLGTGKFTLQYERVFRNTWGATITLDPALTKLATGKLDLEVRDAEKTARKQEKEKERFTAWGKEAGGLQAGLGYLPGQHRTYHTGETVTLVVRVRSVSKEAVKVQYLPRLFDYKGPAVTDSAGKPVDYGYGVNRTEQVHLPTSVSLAPGKEMVLGEVKLPTVVLGTGKFTVQYERVFGKTPQGRLVFD